MAIVKGKYRCTRPLEYPTDPAIIKRIVSGEAVPIAERGHKRAEAGEVVSDLPKASIDVLLRKGWIEEAQDEPVAVALRREEVA